MGIPSRVHRTVQHMPKVLITWLMGCLLLPAGLAAATSGSTERIAWQKVPIPLELKVGAERLVQFPVAVTVGLPAPLQGIVRVQSVAGTVYLLAQQPFAATRVVVRGLDDGRIYLLDLSAKVSPKLSAQLSTPLSREADGAGTDPVEIFDPDEARDERERAEQAGAPAYGYVTLTRFAAQQLYAPARLLEGLPGVVRVPIEGKPVALVRGDTVEAIPLIAWRAGDLYLTALTLTNTTRRAQVLDPRTLRGRWLSATFQHNRLHPAGREADRTVVYLVSARPFAASL